MERYYKQLPSITKGSHEFEVYEIGEKVLCKNGKDSYRKWIFNTFQDGEIQQLHQVFMPWIAIPLLLALGFPENKEGYVDWEPEKAVGKKFSANVVWENVKGKVYARATDFKPPAGIKIDTDESEIPF